MARHMKCWRGQPNGQPRGVKIQNRLFAPSSEFSHLPCRGRGSNSWWPYPAIILDLSYFALVQRYPRLEGSMGVITLAAYRLRFGQNSRAWNATAAHLATWLHQNAPASCLILSSYPLECSYSLLQHPSSELEDQIQISVALGTIHKRRPQNVRDFKPPTPCPHFGLISSTKFAQYPLLCPYLQSLFWS